MYQVTYVLAFVHQMNGKHMALNCTLCTGEVAAGQSVNLVLTFDITQNTFQTVLQASVLITTTGRPAAKVCDHKQLDFFMPVHAPAQCCIVKLRGRRHKPKCCTATGFG